jgi:hypothetical protein
MAQTTVPVYLSGKLGSMVYTGNRQGTAVRMLVTPKNPETAGQTAQRQRFSAAAKAWAAVVHPLHQGNISMAAVEVSQNRTLLGWRRVGTHGWLRDQPAHVSHFRTLFNPQAMLHPIPIPHPASR